MEKDTAAHRRHRPGPGAPPSGGAPRHLKAASEMVELQRSRSVGGLLQKGDPLRCVKKLSRELGGEGRLYPSLLSARAGRGHLAVRTASSSLPAPQEPPLSTATGGGPGGGHADPSCARAQSPLPLPGSLHHPHLFGFHSQKPSVFVEIDLGDHAEEVKALRQQRAAPVSPPLGPLSAPRTRTSWVCCIPYSTRRKAKDSV
uniref:Uncharacterized protein n=1 Tax=Lynx canadensis TaxID=61383 RepID=A0A667FZT7_LYNCA